MTTPAAGDLYHHGDLRAVLLAGAERRLEAGGLTTLSLREVARDIGIGHGAPRQHFPDKQALLDALAIDGLRRLGERLDAALDADNGDFAERLLAFARAHVEFARSHPALSELMFARKYRSDAPELVAANERAVAAPVALIAKAQADGEIDADADPDRLGLTVLATLQGLAVLVTNGMLGTREVDSVLAGTVSTLIEGLCAEDAR